MKFQTVLTAQEIIDKAFRNAKKSKDKVQAFADTVVAKLEQALMLEEIFKLQPFYLDLLDINFDLQKLKKSFRSIRWCKAFLIKLKKTYLRSKNLREFYGRACSAIYEIEQSLELLINVREFLKKLPEVRDKVIVVCGAPNVGKSSLVRAISSAKPEIREYPFTTKQISVGKLKELEIDIMDTPGLLDRPLSKRNKIEMQAILALKHIAFFIIFVVDATETCGYDLEYQSKIFRDIVKSFNLPYLIVLNKKDMLTGEHIKKFEEKFSIKKYVCISAKYKQGIDEVISSIKSELVLSYQASQTS